MHSLTAITAPRLLGVLPEHPSLGESIPFQLTGLAVVFIALGLIWVVLEAMGLYFKRRAPVPSAAPVVSAAPAPAVPAMPADLPPELVAVIAATVQVSLEGPYRIQAIVPVNPGQDWAHEGRRQIFASHQVR